MSDLVTKLRKAFRTFPIIEDSPVDLFNDAAKRIEALKATIKRIEPLPDKWEHEDTGYYLEMSQCAIDLRKALNQQEQDHE